MGDTPGLVQLFLALFSYGLQVVSEEVIEGLPGNLAPFSLRGE